MLPKPSSKISRLERAKYWKSVIDQQEQSGISITDFCTHHKISHSAFYGWLKRLNSEFPNLESPKNNCKSPKFIPIQISNLNSAIVPPNNSGLELHFTNGSKLIIKQALDWNLLNQLIKTMR